MVAYGSYFLMYAQWRNLGAILICFETGTPSGWPIPGGTLGNPIAQ